MADKVQPGELAVKLTHDITGGVGNHSAGTVLRHLSISAYNTLVYGGGHDALKEGDAVTEAIDGGAPLSGEMPADPGYVVEEKAPRTRKRARKAAPAPVGA